MTERSAVAVAHANIALVKYWGKSDRALNLPAVPSISLTLAPLATTTRVTFDPALHDDCMTFGDRPASADDLARVSESLDSIRALAGVEWRASVETHNSFPTASGLASSASGFAALVTAAASALALDLPLSTLSALARRGSASAARSVYGGFARLPAGVPGDDSLCAVPVAPADHWDVRMIVAVTSEGPKDTASRAGMNRVADTSPYYPAWVADAPGIANRAMAAIDARDLESLGALMELSTMRMHACALAGDPPLLYWRPATLA
ncbi:MAG: diphosphomevalonate decarboxylase, partial [Deltaproteobacteria bacterium]|nr:diphosphomevalonate decarboxylase [Deltaproteobacteria bacterium]